MGIIASIDIGYSNTKFAVARDDASVPTLGQGAYIFASGAGPADQVGRAIFGTDQAIEVLIQGKPWVAGVPQRAVAGFVRNLTENYSNTDAYKACFLAALQKMRVEVIDLLVTGLPVSQFGDGEFRRKLQEKLTGQFEVGGGRRVMVRKALVIPQPMGGYSEYAAEATDLADRAVLVLDPGFFSVDWILVDGGLYLNKFCATSVGAVSQILEAALGDVNRQGVKLAKVDVLEDALRKGKSELSLEGRTFPLDQLIGPAQAQVTRTALEEVASSMRSWGRRPDVVILVGGGARLYEKAARETFGAAAVKLVDSPVLANARGFWAYGVNKYQAAVANA